MRLVLSSHPAFWSGLPLYHLYPLHPFGLSLPLYFVKSSLQWMEDEGCLEHPLGPQEAMGGKKYVPRVRLGHLRTKANPIP